MTAQRDLKAVITAHRQLEGGGFVVRRPFPGRTYEMIDPFLLLDEMGPVEYRPGEAVGAPDHPHRGFETVTYVLDGDVDHEDSAGHKGRIGAGDVQWMTAGRGIVHSEMPSRRVRVEGGRVHGFQLWVNLPHADKLMPPRYQEVPGARIPTASTFDGLARVKVIAGKALGVEAVIETRIPITYLDWTLQPGARVEQPVPESQSGFVYVFEGEALVGPRARVVKDGQAALLDAGDTVTLAAKQRARLLLIAGTPLNEPVARYGPFVMSTQEEILQAIQDFRSGKLGMIERK